VRVEGEPGRELVGLGVAQARGVDQGEQRGRGVAAQAAPDQLGHALARDGVRAAGVPHRDQLVGARAHRLPQGQRQHDVGGDALGARLARRGVEPVQVGAPCVEPGLKV
jgi:hypothetical protein